MGGETSEYKNQEPSMLPLHKTVPAGEKAVHRAPPAAHIHKNMIFTVPKNGEADKVWVKERTTERWSRTQVGRVYVEAWWAKKGKADRGWVKERTTERWS